MRRYKPKSVSPFGYIVRYACDGGNLIAEYLWTPTSTTMTRRYVYGPGTDEPIVWYEGSGTADRRWLHADERGSVIAVSDGAGNMLAINRYDEYGIPQSGNVGRFQYTGQVWLPELGMYSYKARMYSPTLGRFMQTDPIGYGDGMNWYNYVGSDPVGRTDPQGTTCYATATGSIYMSRVPCQHDGGGGTGGASGGGGGGAGGTRYSGTLPAGSAPPTTPGDYSWTQFSSGRVEWTYLGPAGSTNLFAASSGGSKFSQTSAESADPDDIVVNGARTKTTVYQATQKCDPHGSGFCWWVNSDGSVNKDLTDKSFEAYKRNNCKIGQMLTGDATGIPGFALSGAGYLSNSQIIFRSGQYFWAITGIGYLIRLANCK